MLATLYRPGGQVIQGYFPGGRPNIVQPAGLTPSVVRPAAPAAAPLLRPRAVQPKASPTRPGTIPGPILPPKAGAVQARPSLMPAPILPPKPSTLQPSSSNAIALPANFFALKPRALGQRLPEAIQRKMEAFFNTEFSEVRVHVGSEASSIGALAFTHGADLYFAPGQYNPLTPQGRRLLGHELAHVVQQRAGRVPNPLGSGIAVVQDPGLEAEAERIGLKVASTPMSPPMRPTSPKPRPIGGAEQSSSMTALAARAVQRMDSDKTAKNLERFNALFGSKTIDISQDEIKNAVGNLDSKPRLWNSQYFLTGNAGAQGGTISISTETVGQIGSIKYQINKTLVYIFEINVRPIYSGQNMFAVLMCASLQAAKSEGADTFTSTNITNMELWRKLVLDKETNIDGFLSLYPTIKLSRTLAVVEPTEVQHEKLMNAYKDKYTF